MSSGSNNQAPPPPAAAVIEPMLSAGKKLRRPAMMTDERDKELPIERREITEAVREQANPEDRVSAVKSFGEFGGVNKSIEASTTYTVLKSTTLPDIFGGRKGVRIEVDRNVHQGGYYLYSRHLNPTALVLGREIAALEGCEAGYPCSSGMAAISSTIMQICSAGDHIVASSAIYGGAFALLKDLLPKYKISTTFVNIANLAEVEAAVTPNTKIIYTETISNPTLVMADVPSLAVLAHRSAERKITLVVDNTFSPLMFTPAKMGADVVLHSITKFINGASDIIAGVVCGRTEFIRQLMDLHQGTYMLFGPTMDPKIAFEVSCRLPHLALRFKEHSRRAMVFATRMRLLGLDVVYPGLPHHPQFELITHLMTKDFGFGGVFTLDCGTKHKAFELLDYLQNTQGFGYNAVSLGYFHTLMSCSAATTSSELSDDDLKRAGIRPGLVRFSIGYTGNLESRWKQLLAGLEHVGLVRRAKM